MSRSQASVRKRTTGARLVDRMMSVVSPGGANASARAETSGDERTRWYKHPLFRKLLFAILSLLLAMLLWGYVLMSQNPDREKTITGIIPKLESGSEADIESRKLTIIGNVADVLKSVDVTIAAPLTEVSKITADNINATVSFNNIYSAGTYEIEVKAVCSVPGVEAKVISVVPNKLEITFDDTVSRSVPITCEFEGELPAEYWHDDPMLFTTSIPLEGARSDLENVQGAVCKINLNGVTSSFTRSIQLTVIDNEGKEMDSSLFRTVIPAVNVQLKVFPHKEVDIEYELTDLDSLSDWYEIQNESLSISKLDIAADAEVLANLDSVKAVPVSISGINGTGDYSFTLTLKGIPSGAVILDGVNKNDIQLIVTVVDKIVSRTFGSVPVQIKGEMEGYTYTFGESTLAENLYADITLTGPARLIDFFVTSDITISVNVANRSEGDYDLELEYKFEKPEGFGDMEVSISPQTVHVRVDETPGEE